MATAIRLIARSGVLRHGGSFMVSKWPIPEVVWLIFRQLIEFLYTDIAVVDVVMPPSTACGFRAPFAQHHG
jgi:hypothetical protein